MHTLRAGQVDVVISGRLPKAEEGEFKVIEYARTPLVFASREAKQIKGFSLGEITEIYAGNRKTWGDGSQIRLVLRSPFESDTQTMKNISPALNVDEKKLVILLDRNVTMFVILS